MSKVWQWEDCGLDARSSRANCCCFTHGAHQGNYCFIVSTGSLGEGCLIVSEGYGPSNLCGTEVEEGFQYYLLLSSKGKASHKILQQGAASFIFAHCRKEKQII